VPFYFINLLPTSLLYISILLAASYISIFHMQGGAAERSGKILPGDTLMDVDGRPVSKQVMEYNALHTYYHL
jgi:hypothetical protein